MAPSTLTATYALLLMVSGVCSQSFGDALYFTDQRTRGVFGMPLAGGRHTRLHTRRLDNPIAVAYDGTADMLYVTERSGDAPARPKFIAQFTHNSQQIHRFQLPWSANPDGLALDTISGLLYYTDAGNNIIGVLTTDLRYNTVIIKEKLSHPRGIVLDPLEGQVYWTDWAHGTERIVRANMDGTNERIIFTGGPFSPNGITIDTTGPVKYLYWCDNSKNHSAIKRCRMDGSEMGTIFNSSRGIFGLAVDENYIYYTNLKKSAIQMIPKNGGKPGILGVVKPYNTTKFFGIAIDKASIRLSGTNACSGTQRGGCAHLCLPTGPNTRVCQCGDGFTLKDGGKGCEKLAFRSALFVSDWNKRVIFTLDLDKNAVSRPTILNHSSPEDIVYDDAIDQYFWVDSGHKHVGSGCVWRTCKTLNYTTTEPASPPVGIALDKSEQVLYIVHRQPAKITRMNYVGKQKVVLINSGIDKPRSIALDTRNGFMYWTDSGSQPRIERAHMKDGGSRTVFVTGGLLKPNGLAIDPLDERLFWTDGGLNRIEMIMLSGTGRRRVYEHGSGSFFGLTYGHGKLYFSTTGHQDIYSLDLKTGSVVPYGDKRFQNVSGLEFFSSEKYTASEKFEWTLITTIAASIGGLIIILLIIVIAVLCCKRMNRQVQQPLPPSPINAIELSRQAVTTAPRPIEEALYAEAREVGAPRQVPRYQEKLPMDYRRELHDVPPPYTEKAHQDQLSHDSVAYANQPHGESHYDDLLVETREPPQEPGPYVNLERW